jgi:electron transport complex protein RnfA
MTSYLFIILGAVLVNNVVFVRILGLCPFMGVSKKLETALGMGAATTFVLTMACGASYIIDRWLLIPNQLEYLRTLSFIVTIAAIVQLTELVIQKTSPVLHQVLGIYLPLITTNCAVLGIPLLNVSLRHNFLESLLFGFGSAMGFTLALILFAGIRERLEAADVPGPFPRHRDRHDHRRPDEPRLHGLRRPGQVQVAMLEAILVMALGAVVLGAALGYAAVRFRVEGDPLVEKIDAILPQTQCGQCGFPGCKPYAQAIAKGRSGDQPVPARRRRRHPQAGRPAGPRIQIAVGGTWH